jgi:sulfonate transport system ATP-binding protein
VLDLWQRHGPAVLLVTHDVDEALVLADRVFVLEAGRIAFERTIPAARPRDRASEAFVRLRGEVLAALGVEDDARETPAERCRPTVSA